MPFGGYNPLDDGPLDEYEDFSPWFKPKEQVVVYEIVQYEVHWHATVGYSGTELPPSTYELLGDFETEGDAAEALAVEGFTRGDYGWKSKSGYGYGRISRVLKEIK